MTFQSLKGNEAFAQKDGDLEVFWNGGTTPGFPLEFQGETGLLLRCVGNIGIPLQMNQGIGPSSRDEEGKLGLFLSCGGKLSVPLEWTGILGTFLICTKGYKYPVTYQEGMWHFSRETLLWKRASSRGEGESRGFSRVVAGNLGFISS